MWLANRPGKEVTSIPDVIRALEILTSKQSSLTGMIFTLSKALLALAAYACSDVLATPITTEHAIKASDVAADQSPKSDASGISGIEFSQSALIRYKYECPVGRSDSRTIQIGVDFNGDETKFRGITNAEHTIAYRVEESGSQTYKVTGTFEHNMCLVRGGFRHCAYSITGALEATARVYQEGAKFNVPSRSGPYNPPPVVTEACTPVNGHAKDCKTAGKPVQCRIVDISFTKGSF